MKIYILGFISVILIGCASSTNANMHATSQSVGLVADFASAIRAYDQSKKIDYLKEADKYATTEQEKAILERKMVEYLGADKVFDVKVSTNYGAQRGIAHTGMLSGNKYAKQKIKIAISVSPKEGIPFTLKYNTYKVFLGLKRKSEYTETTDLTSKIKHTVTTKDITIGLINLKPSNHYSYSKTLNDDIIVYRKAAGFLSNGAKAILQKLQYIPIIDIYPKNAVLKENGLTWQNYYPFTDEHYVKFIEVKAFSEDEAEDYCKNLTIDGGGWRRPIHKDNLRILSSSSIKNELVGTQNQKGKDLYYSNTHDYSWGKMWRPSDFDEKRVKERGWNGLVAIRCVKSTQPTLYDKTTGLEWENRVRWNPGGRSESKKLCQKKGNGWRLPTAKEYSHIIKNHTIDFVDKPNKLNDSWITSTDNKCVDRWSGDIEECRGDLVTCVRRKR